MMDLVFVLMLTSWAAIVGRAILVRLDAVPEHRLDLLALAVPMGFGVLALASLLLGEIGHLDRGGFLVVFAIGLVVSASFPRLPWWRKSAAHGRVREESDLLGDFEVASSGGAGAEVRPSAGSRGPLTHQGRGAEWADRIANLGIRVSLALTVIGTLLTALAPVTDGDALCYHLQVPKVFLLNRGMTFDPDLHETVYPLVTEMLYAVALAFRGPVACRLVQWVLGLSFGASVTALARPILGARAFWAGTIAMLVPAISNGMGAPLNDVALAAFGNAALVAVVFWRESPSAKRAVLAGVLAGMAIGVKYPALVWAGVLGMAMLFPRGQGGRSRNPRSEIREEFANGRPLKSRISNLESVAIFGLAAFLAGVWWYLRAYMHTGNPVYPFFRHVFGGAGIDDVLDPIKRPMAVTLANLVTAIGPMTLQPDRFDSISHQFGPAFLLFVPGLFLLAPPRRIVGLAAVGFAFLTICLTQRQSMRFVLAAVGPFAVAVAWAAEAWWGRRSVPGRLLVAGLVVILAAESMLAVARSRHGLGVVFGRESADAFLARREPTYRVGRWIDGHLARSARIIGQEHRGFYLPRAYAMELAHRRRTGIGSRGESAEEIVDLLRRDGFTHLLMCPPEPESAVEFDPLLSRRLEPWLASRTPLYEEPITDPDGVTRRYGIYDLSPRATLAEARRRRR